MNDISHPQRGFTLVEIIIGIVILSIALGVITNFFATQSKQSADPMHQVRATELAQAVMGEIMAKSFDEASDHAGGVSRCDASTCSSAMGPEESSADLYDDVDDYKSTIPGSGYCTGLDVTTIQDVLADTSIANEYANYCLSINVFYDGNRDGNNDGAYADTKRIKVTIFTASGQEFTFAAHRYNY